MRIEYRQVDGGMFLRCDDCNLVVGFGDSARGDQAMHAFKKNHVCEEVIFKLDTGACP